MPLLENNRPDENRLFREIVGNYNRRFNAPEILKDLYGIGKAPGYSERCAIDKQISGSSNNFSRYLNPKLSNLYKHANMSGVNPDDNYMRLSLSGDITPENEVALTEIDDFLTDSNVYKEFEKLLSGFGYKELNVHLDKGMKPYVMGVTNCRGKQPYCDITINANLYREPYTKIGDKNAQMLVKYLQAGTLMHEWVHKRTAGSKAVKNLSNMGYTNENVRGFLEMLAEMYTIKAFENAGQHALAHIGKMYSPYRAAYKMGERIESEFKSKYGTGLKGLIAALSYDDGNLSYTDAQKYIRPLRVKAPEATHYQGKELYGNECTACSRKDVIKYRCT